MEEDEGIPLRVMGAEEEGLLEDEDDQAETAGLVSRSGGSDADQEEDWMVPRGRGSRYRRVRGDGDGDSSLGLWALVRFYVKTTFNEIRKRKLNFCLGWSACFVVVTSIALLLTIMANTPILFSRLSEAEGGQRDAVAESISYPSTLNWTRASAYVTESAGLTPEQFAYSSPRLLISNSAWKASGCENVNHDTGWRTDLELPVGSVGSEGMPSGPGTVCNYPVSPELLVMDTSQERHVGIGQTWPFETLPMGAVVLSRKAATNMQVAAGQWLIFRVMSTRLWGAAWEDLRRDYGSTNSTTERSPRRNEYVYFPAKVTAVIDELHDKERARVQQLAFMELEPFAQWVSLFANASYPERFVDQLSTVDLKGYATEAVWQLPPNTRKTVYLDSDIDRVEQEVVSWASNLAYLLGFGVTTVSQPIIHLLKEFSYFSLFLGVILNVVTIFFIVLTSILIYSLMQVSVDERTFELGVYRMVGMTRARLVGLLLVQGVTYAIPGWLAGLVAAQALCVALFKMLAGRTGVDVTPSMSAEAVGLASLVGLCVPLIASIAPIKSALSMNVHDAIDVKRSKIKVVSFKLSRAEDNAGGIGAAGVSLGFSLVVFGGLIYYLLPYALLSSSLSIMLNIFVFLLVGLLFGLVLFSLNALHYLESLLITSFLSWWQDTSVTTLVRKSLIAHRKRLRKTSIMYALSVAFVIFAAASWSSQAQQLRYRSMQRNGAYIRVTGSFARSGDGVVSGMSELRKLETFLASTPFVRQWSYITHRLNYLVPGMTRTAVENIGKIRQYGQNVYGVSPNIFTSRTAFKNFLQVDQMDDSVLPNGHMVESLYSPLGSQRGLLGAVLRNPKKLSLSLDEDYLLTSQFMCVGYGTRRICQGYKRVRMRPLAFLGSAPAFTLTSFPRGRNHDMIVSMPTFRRLLGELSDTNSSLSMDQVPIQHVLLDLESTNDAAMDDLIKNIDLVMSGTGVSVHDYRNDLNGLDEADTFLNFFFGFCIVVAMSVCFFSLSSSMVTNIHEQTKEIGVLLALGMKKTLLIRAFVEEAFVVVLASSLLGTIIGVVVAWTMVLQQALFNEFPLPFDMSWNLLSVVFVSSFAFAFLSSFAPARRVTRKSIVSALREL